MIVSLSENQINQVHSYVDTLDARKNKENFFIGKCGEIAVINYGYDNKVFKNFYGQDLFNSVLKNTHHADLGHDLILESFTNHYIRTFTQVKTIACENGNNLLLDKRLYNAKLEYYNSIPQDIYVLTQRLSESTYDVIGYIEHIDAVRFYADEVPVKNCYCINKKFLTPIEEIYKLFQ